MVIKVWQNNHCVGYISRVYYSKGGFALCQSKQKAKSGYKTLDEVMSDIDFCSRTSKGYVFTYE